MQEKGKKSNVSRAAYKPTEERKTDDGLSAEPETKAESDIDAIIASKPTAKKPRAKKPRRAS